VAPAPAARLGHVVGVGGGIVFPIAVLSATLLYSTARTAGLERPLADPQLVVSVTGRLWWWEVRMPELGGQRDLVPGRVNIS